MLHFLKYNSVYALNTALFIIVPMDLPNQINCSIKVAFTFTMAFRFLLQFYSKPFSYLCFALNFETQLLLNTFNALIDCIGLNDAIVFPFGAGIGNG